MKKNKQIYSIRFISRLYSRKKRYVIINFEKANFEKAKLILGRNLSILLKLGLLEFIKNE